MNPHTHAPAPVTNAVATPPRPRATRSPVLSLLARRGAAGVLTLVIVSVIVFWATQVLPGNAATAILGQHATPERIKLLNHQLHLDRGLADQYWAWATGILTGHAGISFTTGQSVAALVGPRLLNSAALMVAAGIIGTILGGGFGMYAAMHKGKAVDRNLSVVMLALASVPEFITGVALVIVFSTLVFHVLPAVSVIPPGEYAWQEPKAMILPVATLVIVTAPYLYRMVRATMIEAANSDYAEYAELKGLSPRRVALVHALPNAVAPSTQVVGLNLLYLAGGIVVVEYVFNFPGVGQGLVNAITDRDVPTIQLIVLILAAFYVVINIITDLIALWATPRRRLAR